jgi:PST family polysaccharide transporter
VGRQLGAEPLGLYYLAFNIGSWAFMVLGPIVASVSVAAFSRVRSDRKQLGGRMGTAMSALVLFAFPASALIAGLAEPLVHAIYGSRWTPAAAALALTAIYGALRVPAELLYNVTIVEGYTRKLFILQIAYLVVLTPLTAVCVARWGIAGAGLAHIVANVALLLPGFLIILSRSTGFTARRLLTSILPPAAAATIVGFVAHLLASQFGNPWVAVSVGSLAGFLLYFTLIQGWGRRVARAGWHLWKDPEIADVFDDDTPEQRESRTPLAPASPESAHA